MWFILFPLISPSTWVCRKDWLGTRTCSRHRSIIGLQIIDDVKNPASLVQKSSTAHVLRGLWLTTQRSSRIKDPTFHKLKVRLFLMGLGCGPESWKPILNSLRKGRILLLQNSIYTLMDRVDTGGLYFSGVPHCLARGYHSIEGANIYNACAKTGEEMPISEGAPSESKYMGGSRFLALRFWYQGGTPVKPSISMPLHRILTKLQSWGIRGSCYIWQIRLVSLLFGVTSVPSPAWPAPFRWILCRHRLWANGDNPYALWPRVGAVSCRSG